MPCFVRLSINQPRTAHMIRRKGRHSDLIGS